MRGWSFPVGRFFGVEVRIDASSCSCSPWRLALARSPDRAPGVCSPSGSCFCSLSPCARLQGVLAAAWFGREVGGILLLPTGGLSTYATREATERAWGLAIERRMAVVGPLANIGFGLLLAAVVLASTPGINLIERPWIAPAHLLRAMVWLNILLGAINLLPAFPLDGGRCLSPRSRQRRAGSRRPATARRAGANPATLLRAHGARPAGPCLLRPAPPPCGRASHPLGTRLAGRNRPGIRVPARSQFGKSGCRNNATHRAFLCRSTPARFVPQGKIRLPGALCG